MAGSMVRGLLGSGLPASYLVITLCASGWALSFPSPVTLTLQDPLLSVASSCLGRGKPAPESTATPGTGRWKRSQDGPFFFLAKLTFGISGCWPHARPLWPSACQLL